MQNIRQLIDSISLFNDKIIQPNRYGMYDSTHTHSLIHIHNDVIRIESINVVEAD